ncbi:eukaryotic translation initiation factor 4B [Fopius arisanus]|uniref:Eukaryotic translation initiation factor 4B n=3 Tax=Fopius arisanus TaxID=64838 RepID=A0A9R1TIV4_9HYME|nr:PREDICTED: eukaryotic translation initiation factor 4B-like [Fopius arisanus]
MASRKKGKKAKMQTVALTEFLASNGGAPTIPLKSTSWADDVEDEHDGYHSRTNKEPIVLPTAPRAARGPGCHDENIPTSPPFVAFVSNLPYDVVEDDLADFFAEMQVTNVRLPKDSTKLRGYGYVEFDDRASLIEALNLTNTTLKTRRVRIEVSNSNSDDRRGGKMGMGRDNRRDGYDDPERTSGDWRSTPREQPSGGDDRFRSRAFDNRDDRSDSDNRPGAWREGDRSTSSFGERRTFRDDNRSERRGFGDGEGRGFGGDRRGYGDGERRGFGDGERRGFGDGERRGFGDGERRGFGDGERRGFGDGERRGFGDRERRGYDDKEEKERDWSRETNTGGTSAFPPRRNDRDRFPEREDASSEPRTRPTLNLLPRTKPIETIVREEKEAQPQEVDKQEPKPEPKPAANIFGAAKPVDTAAKEREIEERLAKSQAEKPKSEEGDSKPQTWTRRNGDGRSDREKEKPRLTWRSDEDRVDRGRHNDRRQAPRAQLSGRSEREHRVDRGDSRGPPSSRATPGSARPTGRYNDSRGPPEKERRDREREREREGKEEPPMPKASDEQAPNFVASNMFSMLDEDAVEADLSHQSD